MSWRRSRKRFALLLVCGLSRDLPDLAPYSYTISSSLLDRHLHRNGYQRIIEFVARGGDDLVYYFHASKDFTEEGVGSVQPAAVIDASIELRAVIVEVLRALWSCILSIKTVSRRVVENPSNQSSSPF